MSWRLSVVLGDFIVNRNLAAGSEEYHLTGQGDSNAKNSNIITCDAPWLTAPELSFEKKQLIPSIQQLLIHHSCK